MSSKTLPLLPTEKAATYRRSLQAVVCDQSNQMSHSLCLPHSTQTHPQAPKATSVAVLSATTKDLKSISPGFTSKARPPLSLNQDFGHAVAIHDVPAVNRMDHLPRQSLAILPMNLSNTIYQQYTNCHTQNVIYLITCDKCQEQYVGETGNSIHTRAYQHRSDVTVGNKNIPTVRHFKRCGRENMKLTVIEKLRSTDQYTRRAREEYWINK